MNYAKMIKKLREKMFLSQEKLAKELNVSFASVNRWEQGYYEPNFETKKKLDKLFKEYDIEEIE